MTKTSDIGSIFIQNIDGSSGWSMYFHQHLMGLGQASVTLVFSVFFVVIS